MKKMQVSRLGLRGSDLRRRTIGYVCTCVFLSVAMSLAYGAVPLPVKEVAPGVFVHQGLQADATPENRGAIANIGFIVGADCVAVIDSGGSFAEGQALHAAIVSRTSTPICYVINTHVHPDHVYGNSAFSDDRPHFVGHRNLTASMRARHDYYVKFLQRTVGPELAQKSRLIEPDIVVESTREIDLGGRKLSLRAWPASHTDNDLTVFDQSTGTLWLGDLLFCERIPVLDGSLSGWLATLDKLKDIKARHVVPGHGPVSSDWPAVMQPQVHYLQRLRSDVRKALQANLSMQQAVAQAGQSERGNWLLFDEVNPHNVTVAFAELEWED